MAVVVVVPVGRAVERGVDDAVEVVVAAGEDSVVTKVATAVVLSPQRNSQLLAQF